MEERSVHISGNKTYQHGNGPGRLFLTGLIFVFVLSLSVYSIATHKQLGRMSGLTEEYVDVAKNLLEYGMAYPHDEIIYVYRPPGYIFFLKTILSVPGHIPQVEGKDLTASIQRHKMSREWISSPVFDLENKLVYFVQAIVFGLTAVFLFLIMGEYCSLRRAFYFSILYGLNLYMMILVGIYHYPVLHLFCIVLSCFVTIKAIQSSQLQSLGMIGAGILWGLTTLVRPTTLIFPVFFLVFALIYFGRNKKKAVRLWICLSLGMALVIMPRTLSNFKKTQQLIPVNAQAWTSLWANTVKRERSNGNHFNWFNVWYKKGMPVYTRVTGAEEYYFPNILLYNLELEDAFRQEALKNIKDQPDVFIKNVGRNLYSFHVDINSVMITLFEAVQDSSENFDVQARLAPGVEQDFHPPLARRVFEVFHAVLLVLGLGGVVLLFVRKEMIGVFIVFVYLCFVVANSLTYVDFTQYYLKMPFLFLFAGYTVHASRQSFALLSVRSIRLSWADVLLASLFILELLLLYLAM